MVPGQPGQPGPHNRRVCFHWAALTDWRVLESLLADVICRLILYAEKKTLKSQYHIRPPLNDPENVHVFALVLYFIVFYDFGTKLSQTQV